MNTMLLDGTYKKLKKDPTARIERHIIIALKECEGKGKMTKKCRVLVTPRVPIPPQLHVRVYSLPKVHKVRFPLRPIVSTIGSPLYNMSKHLAKIVSPLAGQASFNVNNSTLFVEMIQKMSFDETDWMVSFDVVSLSQGYR